MEGLKLRISSPVIEGGMGGDCEKSYCLHIALPILNFKRNPIHALWGLRDCSPSSLSSLLILG